MRLKLTHSLGVMVLLAACGLVHGVWSGRWSEVPAQSVDNLLSGDESIGDWRPEEFVTVDPSELPPGTKTISRRYANAKLRKTIVVSVTAGHPGVVSVHTPDICYLGAGYKLKSEVKSEAIEGANGSRSQFNTAEFSKQSTAGTENIRVRWAWSANGKWSAPNSPRFSFMRVPLLYKLYIVHSVIEDEDLTKNDPYRKFVADLATSLEGRFTRSPSD